MRPGRSTKNPGKIVENCQTSEPKTFLSVVRACGNA
jgi:hypothetical protein